MNIKKINYDSHVEYKNYRKPLMIGCSGGNGHIAAINGIKEFLEELYKGRIKFPAYTPVLPENKQASPQKTQINRGVGVMHSPVIGRPLRAILQRTYLPVLPNQEELAEEIASLSQKEEELPNKTRWYVNMLLDVYRAGYESAAIWNVLQRNDKVNELRKLVELQENSDAANYQDVYDYYFNLLNQAADSDEPYTEIISTQAMALPALCDAVKDYNKKKKPDHPQVIIHQYMTDLPTKGAIHFFGALSHLTAEQQQQMKLYGVGLTEEVLRECLPEALQERLPEGTHFNGLYNIPPEENPMVRPGFKNPDLDKSNQFDKETTITVKENGGKKTFTIAANEKIASIMLGSQASNETAEYIETLLQNGMDKIFVFGGTNSVIKNKIDTLIAKNPDLQNRIIPLANQSDQEMAPLMKRSNIVVIRGGGLSVMEQMAMSHNPKQLVLIHHTDSPTGELTSGIRWEDYNVACLIDFFTKKNIIAIKTSPEYAKHQIAPLLSLAVAKEEKHIAIDNMTLFQYIAERSLLTPENNQPLSHLYAARHAVKNNTRLKQVNNTFYPIDNEGVNYTDVKRANLVVGGTCINGLTPDEEIERLLNSLSADEGVRYFLSRKFNQNVFLFAGHDSLQDEVLQPELKLYKLSNELTLLESSGKSQVMCRIITYGYNLTDFSNTGGELVEVIPGKENNPSMIIDTLFRISPANKEGQKGARLEAISQNKLIYHPQLAYYLPPLKSSIKDYLYNYLRDNPINTTASALIGSGVSLASIAATHALAPENVLGELATHLLNFSSTSGVFGMLGSMLTGGAVTMCSYAGLGTLMTQLKTGKTAMEYNTLIRNSLNSQVTIDLTEVSVRPLTLERPQDEAEADAVFSESKAVDDYQNAVITIGEDDAFELQEIRIEHGIDDKIKLIDKVPETVLSPTKVAGTFFNKNKPLDSGVTPTPEKGICVV